MPKYQMLTLRTVGCHPSPVTSAVTLAGPDEECSYEEIFVYIQPAPWKAEMVVVHSLKTSGCDEMPFV